MDSDIYYFQMCIYLIFVCVWARDGNAYSAYDSCNSLSFDHPLSDLYTNDYVQDICVNPRLLCLGYNCLRSSTFPVLPQF